MRLKLTPWTMLSTMLTHDMQFKELHVWEREREREILARQTFFTLASNKELLILCVWSGPGNHSSSNLMKVFLLCSQWPHVGQWSYNQSTGNPTVGGKNKQKKTYLDPNNSLYLCMFDIFIFYELKRTSVSDNFSIKDHPHRLTSVTTTQSTRIHHVMTTTSGKLLLFLAFSAVNNKRKSLKAMQRPDNVSADSVDGCPRFNHDCLLALTHATSTAISSCSATNLPTLW